MSAQPQMLANHRRAFLWSLALLACCVASLFLVGRHPPQAAPLTTVRFVGRFDTTMYGWMLDVRNAWLTWRQKRHWVARGWSGLLVIACLTTLWVALTFKLIAFNVNY